MSPSRVWAKKQGAVFLETRADIDPLLLRFYATKGGRQLLAMSNALHDIFNMT